MKALKLIEDYFQPSIVDVDESALQSREPPAHFEF